MTEQVMWKVPTWGLTSQLPLQTVIVRIASQDVFTKCSSFQISHLIVTVEFSPFFEAIFSLVILLHVKTSNVKGNDHQLKKLLSVKQILLVSSSGNV